MRVGRSLGRVIQDSQTARYRQMLAEAATWQRMVRQMTEVLGNFRHAAAEGASVDLDSQGCRSISLSLSLSLFLSLLVCPTHLVSFVSVVSSFYDLPVCVYLSPYCAPCRCKKSFRELINKLFGIVGYMGDRMSPVAFRYMNGRLFTLTSVSYAGRF